MFAENDSSQPLSHQTLLQAHYYAYPYWIDNINAWYDSNGNGIHFERFEFTLSLFLPSRLFIGPYQLSSSSTARKFITLHRMTCRAWAKTNRVTWVRSCYVRIKSWSDEKKKNSRNETNCECKYLSCRNHAIFWFNAYVCVRSKWVTCLWTNIP